MSFLHLVQVHDNRNDVAKQPISTTLVLGPNYGILLITDPPPHDSYIKL